MRLCDRHGIMILAGLLLANPADGPDPYYPEMFIANAEDYVKRIRSHASIGLYCGRNEGFPPEQIDKALRRIIKEDHPDIHYISSSADDRGERPRPVPYASGKRIFHAEDRQR